MLEKLRLTESFIITGEIDGVSAVNTSLIKKTSTKDLNQRAVRPYKTGFVLDKAKEFLNYKKSKVNEMKLARGNLRRIILETIKKQGR